MSCNFDVQNAHQRHSNTVVMNAKGTIKCTASINNVKVILKMQRYSGGKWSDVAGTQHTTPFATIPANVSKGFSTNDVPCKAGT